MVGHQLDHRWADDGRRDPLTFHQFEEVGRFEAGHDHGGGARREQRPGDHARRVAERAGRQIAVVLAETAEHQGQLVAHVGPSPHGVQDALRQSGGARREADDVRIVLAEGHIRALRCRAGEQILVVQRPVRGRADHDDRPHASQPRQHRGDRFVVRVLHDQGIRAGKFEQVPVPVGYVVRIERAADVAAECQPGHLLQGLERVVGEQRHPVAGADPGSVQRACQPARALEQLRVGLLAIAADDRDVVPVDSRALAQQCRRIHASLLRACRRVGRRPGWSAARPGPGCRLAPRRRSRVRHTAVASCRSRRRAHR